MLNSLHNCLNDICIFIKSKFGIESYMQNYEKSSLNSMVTKYSKFHITVWKIPTCLIAGFYRLETSKQKYKSLKSRYRRLSPPKYIAKVIWHKINWLFFPIVFPVLSTVLLLFQLRQFPLYWLLFLLLWKSTKVNEVHTANIYIYIYISSAWDYLLVVKWQTTQIKCIHLLCSLISCFLYTLYLLYVVECFYWMVWKKCGEMKHVFLLGKM